MTAPASPSAAPSRLKAIGIPFLILVGLPAILYLAWYAWALTAGKRAWGDVGAFVASVRQVAGADSARLAAVDTSAAVRMPIVMGNEVLGEVEGRLEVAPVGDGGAPRARRVVDSLRLGLRAAFVDSGASVLLAGRFTRTSLPPLRGFVAVVDSTVPHRMLRLVPEREATGPGRGQLWVGPPPVVLHLR